MIDCPTENRMGSQTELDSNSRCICPRKRKEHDDVSEQDVKFSKSSPLESPVLSFMKKWTETPLTPENLIQETLKEQVNNTFQLVIKIYCIYHEKYQLLKKRS